jgi:hypothetical protein
MVTLSEEMRFIRQPGGNPELNQGQTEPRTSPWMHLASFLRGMGSVLQLMPPPLVISRRTNGDAIRGDWLRIGADLSRAIERASAERGRD